MKYVVCALKRLAFSLTVRFSSRLCFSESLQIINILAQTGVKEALSDIDAQQPITGESYRDVKL